MTVNIRYADFPIDSSNVEDSRIIHVSKMGLQDGQVLAGL